MSAHVTALYSGHDMHSGMDLLLTVYSDGHHEVATRPGPDRSVRWSPPVALTPVPVSRGPLTDDGKPPVRVPEQRGAAW